MPGQRMLHESICTDKKLNKVSDGAENLFYRLLSKTDDMANVFADLDLVKSHIYSRKLDLTLNIIKERLLELHNVRDEDDESDKKGLIIIYKAKGAFFAHFPNFTKHQTLRKDIKPKIYYPEPTRNDLLRTCNDPFTQVSKLSKKVSKEESNIDHISNICDELKKLKILFPREGDLETIKSLLKNMNFTEEEINKAVTKK